MQMSDFNELMDWHEDDLDAESSTVGGWTTEMYGAFPKEGDGFTFLNAELKVLEMDGRRVSRVMVQKTEK